MHIPTPQIVIIRVRSLSAWYMNVFSWNIYSWKQYEYIRNSSTVIVIEHSCLWGGGVVVWARCIRNMPIPYDIRIGGLMPTTVWMLYAPSCVQVFHSFHARLHRCFSFLVYVFLSCVLTNDFHFVVSSAESSSFIYSCTLRPSCSRVFWIDEAFRPISVSFLRCCESRTSKYPPTIDMMLHRGSWLTGM